MIDTSRAYARPPVSQAYSGKPRHVGVEIELTGPEVELLVDRVEGVFGGQRRHISDVEWEVSESGLGTFRIEVDFDLLKRVARHEKESGEWLDTLASKALGSLSKGIVPCEIVSPPIPLSRLHEIDRLIDVLRRDGAKGTRDSIWNAFGLHLNVEAPSLSAESLLAYLRAYLCLHDWLVEVERVDIKRRIAPYINPFGNDYVRHVLAPDYAPDLPTLIDDYLLFNPTRNRALDMLPLFTFIDEPRVRATVTSRLVRARPTYHYRLPNCEIDDGSWALHTAWNHWCQVEWLAHDHNRLRKICALLLEHLDGFTPDLFDPWKDKIKPWLIDPLSV